MANGTSALGPRLPRRGLYDPRLRFHASLTRPQTSRTWPHEYPLALAGRAVRPLIAVGRSDAAAADRKPNVLIFLSDDVGWGEYGFQGGKDIPTPNIDSIARNGVRFTQGYVSGPYCSPTRAGLMTGRYQTRFGHENNNVGRAVSRPAAHRDDDRRPAPRPGVRHLPRSASGTSAAARVPPDEARVRRVLRHVANTPVLPPAPVRRLPGLARRRGRSTDDAFYTTDAYADRAVDWLGQAQGQAVVPVPAVQRPARPAPGAREVPRPVPEHHRRDAEDLRGDDVGDGRRGRAGCWAKVREHGPGGEHAGLLLLRQRRPDRGQTTSSNGPLRGFKAHDLGRGRPRPVLRPVEGDAPGGQDV